jgi:hypothetical protein
MPEQVVRDSIVERTVVERVRDTTVVIQPDSSLIEALLECDSLRRVQIKQITKMVPGSNLPAPTLTIRDNILRAEVQTKYRQLYLQLKDKYEQLVIKKEQKIVQVVEVNVLRWYQKTLIFIGLFALLIIVIQLIIKLK